MGQKVNPNCFRIGITNSWQSSWYSNENDYKIKLYQDIKIRKFIFKKFKHASIAKINIDRLISKIVINIYSSKPGLIIGKKGADIEKIKNNIIEITNSVVVISILELKKFEIHPFLIANFISEQLEKRVSFRKVIKRVISNTIKSGVEGIKVNIKGRLGGTEIARTEWHKEGRVPLHTLKFKVDYAFAEAYTTYGIIGVKVWTYII